MRAPLMLLQLLLIALCASVQRVEGALEPRQTGSVEQIHLAVGRNPGDFVITFLTLGPTVGAAPSVREHRPIPF